MKQPLSSVVLLLDAFYDEGGTERPLPPPLTHFLRPTKPPLEGKKRRRKRGEIPNSQLREARKAEEEEEECGNGLGIQSFGFGFGLN